MVCSAAEARLQRILSTLPYVQSPRSYLWKLNAFYLGCMDRAAHPDRSDLNTKLVGIINNLGEPATSAQCSWRVVHFQLVHYALPVICYVLYQ